MSHPSQSVIRTVCLDLAAPCPRVIPTPTEGVVLALGNFDGVHIAHQALLQEAVRQKNAHPGLCRAGVFCFWRPSSDYFTNDPQHLTTLKEKLKQFASVGLDFACFCDFDKARHIGKDAFLNFLNHSLSCRYAVCGFNYRFGEGGKGTATDLADHFAALEGATVLPAVERAGLPVSSSRIRSLLLAGKPQEAASLMGRPYALEATVRHGKHLGHALGFPTINQSFLPDSLVPAHGVYAVRCHTPLGIFGGVANVGVRPTVDVHGAMNCETHIFGFEGDLYGATVRVEFLEFLRPETKFDSHEKLIRAIGQDVQHATKYFEEHPLIP